MASYGFLRTPLDGDTTEPTVGDVLRGKSGELPDLVHTHPSETLRDAIEILREYGVSQMPVVSAPNRRSWRARSRPACPSATC